MESGGRAGNGTWVGAAGFSGTVVVAGVALYLMQRGPESPTPAAGPAAPAGQTAPAPDISQMTPRERADRLFDRIVRAGERGDEAEVEFFRPMALQAYALLPELDWDARYHVGLIHVLSGNLTSARAELDTLQAESPTYLLASMLDFSIAQVAADSSGMTRAYRRFLQAYDQESAAGHPDYESHAPAITAFLEAARQAVGPGGPS